MERLNGVHAFGYNSAGSEPISMKFGTLWVHCLPLALADFGPNPHRSKSASRSFVFFCLVNNTRLYQYPVGQICTQDVDLRGGKSFWNKILKIFPQEVVFSKMASLWIISPTTSDCRRPELSNDIYIDENSRLHDPSTECPLSNLTVGINSKSFPWPVQRARGVHFWIRDQAWFTYF